MSDQNDDPRLSALIKDGDSGDIVLVGCPYDFFRRRTIQKGGQQNGPCCLRRFYAKVGALKNCQYDIDISGLRVSDMGNISIQIDEQQEKERFKNVKTRRFKGQYVNYQKQSPQKIINHISNTLINLISNNQVPIVIGGSKQTTLASCEAFFKNFTQNCSYIIISGRPFLKRPYDGDKGTSDNILTIINQKYPKMKKIIFGPNIKYFPQQHTIYDKDTQIVKPKPIHNIDYVLDTQIRQQNIANYKIGQTTQGYHKFKTIYPTENKTFITLSLEAVCRFMGCRDIGLQGLQNQEMCQIMMFLGRQQNLIGIDITQFNPSCEDYQSSLVILNFIYYFLMGKANKQV